jgi:hypothetical protein
MILKSPNSKLSIVNLLSDFILNKIPKKEETIIQVVDCVNFYVIKGKTTYKQPLNISEVRDEFITKFESLIGERKISHTIDLIEYNVDLKKPTSLTFPYHKSQNTSYTHSQINAYLEDNTISYDYNFTLTPIIEEDKMFFYSEFPHGYSLKQGRLLYYYGKHISYNIPSIYQHSTSIFELSINKNEHGEPIFSIKNNLGVDNLLTSAVLDAFDFDMSWLENEIKKVDWSIEITNPLEDYDFLKKKNKDFIIF